MACSLCYERKDSLIDLSGDEAKQFHITSILYKFFAFCFPVSSSNLTLNSHLSWKNIQNCFRFSFFNQHLFAFAG